MTDPLFLARRSLVRVAVVSAVLVAAAALLARTQARRARERARTLPAAASAYPSALRSAVEGLLEARFRTAAGVPVCATTFLGAEPAAGARRRVFVRAVCRELCAREGVVASGASAGFPASISLVAEGGRWHPVGFDTPSEAHAPGDLRAIFPPAVRQRMGLDPSDELVGQRMAERVRERFPASQWLGEGAPTGCAAGGAG